MVSASVTLAGVGGLLDRCVQDVLRNQHCAALVGGLEESNLGLADPEGFIGGQVLGDKVRRALLDIQYTDLGGLAMGLERISRHLEFIRAVKRGMQSQLRYVLRTVYRTSSPVEFGMPDERRGAESSTSGVNLAARIVIMRSYKRR